MKQKSLKQQIADAVIAGFAPAIEREIGGEYEVEVHKVSNLEAVVRAKHRAGQMPRYFSVKISEPWS